MSLPDADLEVTEHGTGEPVLVIQTAVTADELLPLARHPLLRDDFRVIAYHRRGYAGSSPDPGPGSIARDAGDARELLALLGVDRAHVAGASYSAAVAMQLATTCPALVHTLCLMEPPPLQVPSADAFRAASADLLADHRRVGAVAALDRAMTRIVGPDWRTDVERHLPGGVAQVDRDAETFLRADIPALLSWQFTREDARRIGQPVLHVAGEDSGPWFAEVRELVLAWFPQARDVVLPGADHSLALTHAPQVAAELSAFLHAHPISS